MKGSVSDPEVLGTQFALIRTRDQNPAALRPLTQDDEVEAALVSSEFAGATPIELAKFTAEHFNGEKGEISDYYCVALDKRSAIDSTCVVIREDDEKGALSVRIPFALTGIVFGMAVGVGLIMEDMIYKAEQTEDGVYRL